MFLFALLIIALISTIFIPVKLWLNSLMCWLVASLLSVHRKKNVQACSGP